MKPPFVFRSRMVIGATAGIAMAVVGTVGLVATLVDTADKAKPAQLEAVAEPPAPLIEPEAMPLTGMPAGETSNAPASAVERLEFEAGDEVVVRAPMQRRARLARKVPRRSKARPARQVSARTERRSAGLAVASTIPSLEAPSGGVPVTEEPMISVPLSPTRASVDAAMSSIIDRVGDCYERKPEHLAVELTIGGKDGRVTAVEVGGPPPGRACVARAVLALRFTRFLKGEATFRHVYALW